MADGYPMEQKGISLAPSNIASIKATISTVSQSGIFTPIAGRPFNIAHKPSGDFVGSYQLEKKFAGDATWYVALGYADLPSLPETFPLVETEVGVTYRWNVTARTGGSLVVRFSA